VEKQSLDFLAWGGSQNRNYSSQMAMSVDPRLGEGSRVSIVISIRSYAVKEVLIATESSEMFADNVDSYPKEPRTRVALVRVEGVPIGESAVEGLAGEFLG
jgi:hypothetical protein